MKHWFFTGILLLPLFLVLLEMAFIRIFIFMDDIPCTDISDVIETFQNNLFDIALLLKYRDIS